MFVPCLLFKIIYGSKSLQGILSVHLQIFFAYHHSDQTRKTTQSNYFPPKSSHFSVTSRTQSTSSEWQRDIKNNSQVSQEISNIRRVHQMVYCILNYVTNIIIEYLECSCDDIVPGLRNLFKNLFKLEIRYSNILFKHIQNRQGGI